MPIWTPLSITFSCLNLVSLGILFAGAGLYANDNKSLGTWLMVGAAYATQIFVPLVKFFTGIINPLLLTFDILSGISFVTLFVGVGFNINKTFENVWISNGLMIAGGIAWAVFIALYSLTLLNIIK